MTEANALNEDPVTLIERAQRIHVYSNMPSLAHGVIRELVAALQTAQARVLSLETEVEQWKAQAAGEYLKNRDLEG